MCLFYRYSTLVNLMRVDFCGMNSPALGVPFQVDHRISHRTASRSCTTSGLCNSTRKCHDLLSLHRYRRTIPESRGTGKIILPSRSIDSAHAMHLSIHLCGNASQMCPSPRPMHILGPSRSSSSIPRAPQRSTSFTKGEMSTLSGRCPVAAMSYYLSTYSLNH